MNMQKWLWNWIMGRDWKNGEVCDGKSLDCLKQNDDRKSDEDATSEG
jgi:hypothetical protein